MVFYLFLIIFLNFSFDSEWVTTKRHMTAEHRLAQTVQTLQADVHSSPASSRLNWPPRRFKWTRPFRRKTKSGFCVCAVTFQTQSKTRSKHEGHTGTQGRILLKRNLNKTEEHELDSSAAWQVMDCCERSNEPSGTTKCEAVLVSLKKYLHPLGLAPWT